MVRRKDLGLAPIFGTWKFSKVSYILFFVGFFDIALAYLIMAGGEEASSFQSITLAPLMLVIGYIVIIPLAIIYRSKSTRQEKAPSEV